MWQKSKQQKIEQQRFFDAKILVGEVERNGHSITPHVKKIINFILHSLELQ